MVIKITAEEFYDAVIFVCAGNELKFVPVRNTVRKGNKYLL